MVLRRHVLWILSLLLCFSRAAFCQTIDPADDAPQPHSPAESLAMFEVEAGFHVELVAAEPDLADPVSICFDADGRIYASEIHGYNLDGHFDIQELNKKGKLDKQVRRIQATDWAKEKAKPLTYGTVKLLIDEDGDGRVDQSHVFADQLPACYGVIPSRDGIIALCSPDIYFLADRDGDGKAEVKQLLFSGLNEGELWSRANHLVLGLDNWIYACNGRGGPCTIKGPFLKEAVLLNGSNFRFRDDGSAFEPATGAPGGFGLGMSDWGEQFLINNSTNGLQVTPIPYRYQLRNPNVAAPGSYRHAATYSEVYPISNPHPWRSERGRHKAWRDFYGHGEANPNGSFTAACSPTIYRGGAFPKEYQDNLFSCESQQNLINRAVLDRDGSQISLRRPTDFAKREFLASREGWFRPVNLNTGPDGALYIVDMYREIIEDYSAIPRYLQQQYGLTQGVDRGRIWRVVSGNAASTKPMNLADASANELVRAIADPNALWRHTAQRLLIERGEKAAVPGLRSIVLSGPLPQSRIHALYALDGLDSLDVESLLAALSDDHRAVRLHALRLSDSRLNEEPQLSKQILAMVDDSDPTVRLQLALTLGEWGDRDAVGSALATLAANHLSEHWMREAIMSSVSASADKIVANLIGRHKVGDDVHSLLQPLCKMVGSQREPDSIANLLASVADLDGKEMPAIQVVCLTAMQEGLDGATTPTDHSDSKTALARLLKSPSVQVNLLAYQIATALRIDDLPEVAEMFATASANVLDPELSVLDRKSAIQLLSGASFEQLQPLASEILTSRHPVELQLALIDAITRTEDPAAAETMLVGWRGYTPRVQQRVLDAMFERQDRLAALVAAIEDERVAPAMLTSLQRLRLLENSDQKLVTRAKKLFQSGGPEAEQRLVSYREALSGPRDPAAGKQAFAKSCASCHRVEDQGFEVGPPLSSAINRPDEALITEILRPSDRITQGYRVYNVATIDGRIFNGVLAEESATSVTLKRDKGEQKTILRKDIDQLVASSNSLMPDDLHKQVTPTDLANMLAYLRGVYGPPVPSSVTLFDEDPQFVDLLTEGAGVASMESGDAFSGERYLSITPLQKHSRQIADWKFPIAEHPEPGEYRYLRMAWRCDEAAAGVLLEIAASQDWPDSTEAARRYYSGTNTTKWNAHQVSATQPRQWTIVTVDLWKDCGSFVLTGIAPTAMGGRVYFDDIRLYASLEEIQ